MSGLLVNVRQELAHSERFKSLTPRELESYNELKTAVITRLFHFWVVLLEKYVDTGCVGMSAITFILQALALTCNSRSVSKKGKAKADEGGTEWLAELEGEQSKGFFNLLFKCILCPSSSEIGYTYDELETALESGRNALTSGNAFETFNLSR